MSESATYKAHMHHAIHTQYHNKSNIGISLCSTGTTHQIRTEHKQHTYTSLKWCVHTVSSGRFNGGSFVVGLHGKVLLQMGTEPGVAVLDIPMSAVQALHAQALGRMGWCLR